MNPSASNGVGINYVPASSLTQPQASADEGNGGNWVTHLLPTAGGILGGIGGGLLTAGMGGEIVGAGGGAAIGKALENALEGKQALQADDLTAGAEGAIGQGVGGILGKALGAGANFLLNRGTSLATDAAEQAATKAAADQAVDEASATRNYFGGIKPDVQSANDLAGNQELLKSFGVDHTSPEAMQAASKGGLFIDNLHNEALALGKPIKTTDLLSTHDIVSATPEEQQALANSGIITSEGTMPTTVTPAQANAFAQDLNAQLRDLKLTMQKAQDNGLATEYNAAKAQYSNLKNLYKNVQNIAATPEVNKAIADRIITPAEKQQLVEQFGQPEADYIEKLVNEAQTHQDLIKAKLPFAQMNNLSTSALNDLKATGTPLAVARAKGEVAEAPDAAPSGNGGLMTHLADGAGLLTAVTGHPQGLVLPLIAHGAPLAAKVAQNPGILQTLGRIGALGAKLAPAAGVAATTAPNLGADPVAAVSPAANPQGATMGAMSSNQPAAGVNPTSPESVLNTYMGLGLTDPYLLSETSPVVQSLTPLVQKNQVLRSELNALPGFYGNAGGAQGMGGILSMIASRIPGTAANAYERQRAATAAALAQTMGISPEAAYGILPSLMNNPETAGLSQGILGSLRGQLAY